MIPNKITPERLKDYDCLTVGQLLQIIEDNNLSKDAKILVERVEDVYFEKHGWEVYTRFGDNSYRKEDGTIEEESLDQFHPAHYAFKESENILCIIQHY